MISFTMYNRTRECWYTDHNKVIRCWSLCLLTWQKHYKMNFKEALAFSLERSYGWAGNLTGAEYCYLHSERVWEGAEKNYFQLKVHSTVGTVQSWFSPWTCPSQPKEMTEYQSEWAPSGHSAVPVPPLFKPLLVNRRSQTPALGPDLATTNSCSAH